MSEIEPTFFQEPYQREKFLTFLVSFLPEDFSIKEEDFYKPDKYKTITDSYRIGQVPSLDLSVIEITHNTKDARIAIATDAFKLMADNWIHRALIIFKNDTDNYRFSYLTIKLDENSKGKVVHTYSNPRRYSFFLGADAKINTPYQQLIKSGRVKDIDDLQNRFSLEVVNKEFYKQLVGFFNELVKKETGAMQLPEEQNDDVRKHFVVRLIGRIIFTWFLKQKSSPKGQLVPDEILSSKAVAAEKYVGGYYHDRLERLFFELLNTPIDRRNLRNDLFDLVPYLNGGLFSPHSDDFYKLNQNTGYSEYLNTLKISDDWFARFFEFLETYNFTIDENTAFDQDLSIDPEMLGRIFENLLAEIDEDTGESARKATGSFYTPREIVEYMVDESLLAYFKEKTDIAEDKLKALISYDRDDDKEHPLEDGDKRKIIDAVAELKTLDPACGSGAFPIGMLQKLVYILYVVDEEGVLWRAKRLENVAPIYRQSIEAEFDSQTKNYIRKIELIEKSIYGVDIQPIATEVARLRTFLTLIVDEEINDNKENRGIKPLPNLEFKFVSANTLIPLPESNSQTLFDDKEGIKKLSEIMAEYFSSRDKESVKVKFQQVQKQIFQHMIQIGHAADLTQKLATWDPFSDESVGWFDPKWMFGVEDGFDIVIGNPPYVSLEKIKENKDIYKEYYSVFAPRGDLYTLFYERGLQLARNNGYLIYITSNKWMRAGYGEKLRGYFAEKNPLKLIDFGGFKVFESATVDTNILLIQNTPNRNHLEACHFKNDYKRGQSIAEYFEQNKVVLKNLNSDTWFIGSHAEIALKEKIERIGTPLKDWDVKIYRGILTGFNEAFIIDEAVRLKLIAEDPKSEEIIKPLLRGRDIKRYGYEWKGLYLINTHNGYIDENGDKVPPINVKDYPAIKKWLDQYYERLKKRTDKGVTPYNLRDCAYLQEFEKEKIMWQEMVQENSFIFDNDGFFCNDTARIMTGENLKFLLAIFNSKLFFFAIKQFYGGGALGAKGIRMKHTFFEKFPIPEITPENAVIAKQIERLVDNILTAKVQNPSVDTSTLEDQIDELVFELYGLSEEQKVLVKNYE